MSRSLRATAIAAPLFCLSTCVEWGGILSAAWPGDLSRYIVIANRTFAGHIPYRSGNFVEYPPLALPAFLLPRAISERHYDLVFKLLMIVCWTGAMWLVARLLERLGASSQRMALTLGTMALTPSLLGQVFLNRYDPYAALICLLALAALTSGRDRLGSGWVAAGFETKVFPIAAAPVVAIRIWRRGGRRELAAAVGVFVSVCAAVSGFFLVVAFGGIGYSYKSQVTRGLQIESMGSSILLVADKLGLYSAHAVNAPPGEVNLGGGLANTVADLSFVVEIVAIAAVAWAYWRARSDGPDLFLSAFAGSIVAYTIFSKVLSPQYLTWLVPLVALTRTRRVTVLMVASLLLTQAEVYYGKYGLPDLDWSIWVLTARNLCLIAIFVVLLGELRPGRHALEAPAAPAGLGPASRGAPAHGLRGRRLKSLNSIGRRNVICDQTRCRSSARASFASDDA